MNTRNRTPSEYVYYGLYLYFSGLSLRRVSERLSCFINRNHVLVAKKWNWVQRYHPKKISSKKRRIVEFIVDETLNKVGSEYIWLWIAIEPKTGKFSHYSNKTKERDTCLLPNDIFQV